MYLIIEEFRDGSVAIVDEFIHEDDARIMRRRIAKRIPSGRFGVMNTLTPTRCLDDYGYPTSLGRAIIERLTREVIS